MGLKFTPDDYRREPELWLANQTGHMALGAAMAILVCAAFLSVAGEFPVRSVVFAAIAFFYVGWIELRGQGWQGWDTAEDTVFVVMYGSAPVLFAFREIVPGSPEFIGNIWHVTPFLAVAMVHLAIGGMWRVRMRRKGGDDQSG